MLNHRDTRSHIHAPSRSRTGRRPLEQVLKREAAQPDADTALELLLALPPQGRRAVLETLKNRSAQ